MPLNIQSSLPLTLPRGIPPSTAVYDERLIKGKNTAHFLCAPSIEFTNGRIKKLAITIIFLLGSLNWLLLQNTILRRFDKTEVVENYAKLIDKTEVVDNYAKLNKSVNAPSTDRASLCTDEQRKKIAHQLQFPDDADFNSSIHTTYLGIRAPWFRCPDAVWLEKIYEEEADIGNDNSFLGISVGCNKGHDAIRTARMGLSSEAFDALAWKNSFQTEETSACKQENSRQASIIHPKRDGEMHCIEPMPSTFLALKNASDSLNLQEKGFVITHAAISSTHGKVRFPAANVTAGSIGTEDIGIDYCNSKGADDPGCEEVPVFSLEDYFDKYVRAKGPVNILQIDVEGWDFDVLFGASSVLDRTHYLEFEYHNSGNWNKYHLPDAIRLLDGKGFTCYWAAKYGRLWRITECYFDIYNYWHGWSNIACVHRSQNKLAGKMERIFLDLLEMW
mmetsp:Transcript_57106/g.66732  ORF Transcript_57106/g.66732 Transcript_57106/m.66732 type:complete len:446 (-) Transcript_57106:163-1500(-)